MNTEDAVWLAAVIDCEGTLGLTRSCRKERRKTTGEVAENVTYAALIMITNTYVPMLERARLLMGSDEIIQSRSARLGTKTCYQVFLRNRARILVVLREIEPYLMEKRELARRIIGWLEWFQEVRVSPSGRRLSPAQKRLSREEYERRAQHVRDVMTRSKAPTTPSVAQAA